MALETDIRCSKRSPSLRETDPFPLGRFLPSGNGYSSLQAQSVLLKLIRFLLDDSRLRETDIHCSKCNHSLRENLGLFILETVKKKKKSFDKCLF